MFVFVHLSDCLEPTGLENGDILDIKMSASSSFDDLRTAPGRARLNHPEGKFLFNFLACNISVQMPQMTKAFAQRPLCTLRRSYCVVGDLTARPWRPYGDPTALI